MEDMKVAQVWFASDEWGDENDPNSDWALACTYASFVHKDACEFIFYIEEDSSSDYEDFGFSEHFINTLKKAQESGYKYICIYS